MTADDIAIRSATPADVPAIVTFNALNHHPRPDGRPNPRIAARTGDLLSGRHPTCSVDHCLVVELAGRIVGSATAIPQTWTLDGTSFRVEMIEFVAVDRSLRGRGLGRQLMDEIHVAIATRDTTLTAIIGRPSFYSRFGYHALPVGTADHQVAPPATPVPPATAFTIRPATVDDLDLIETSQPSTGLQVRRDRRTLAYELSGRHADSVFRRDLRLVVDAADQPVGWFTITPDDPQPSIDNVVALGPTDLADVVGAITNADRAATYALGPRHPAASPLERTGPHHRLHVRVADPQPLLNAAAARCDEGLVLAVDHELWQIGPGLPPRLDASDELQFDNADVHLSGAAFVRLALGLEHVATVADYDADVEFRTPSARDHLTRLFPTGPVHLWTVG